MDSQASNCNQASNDGLPNYDFDYPSFESCVSPTTAAESTSFNDISIPTSVLSGSNGGHHSPLKKSTARTDAGSNGNNNVVYDTKVIKFPAKNVPKNPEKFFSELKTKVSQLDSQIVATKLPCGGYNILVMSPREKAADAASLVERELQPKITKKIRLETRRFTMLTSKNFEAAKDALQDVAKNVIVGSQQNNTLSITGTASDVSRALQLITKYMDKATASETLTIDDIPPKFYSHIRGAFNCHVTRIIAECDDCVSIDIPQPSIQPTNVRPITITGPQEYQEKAKNEIIKVYNTVRKNTIVKTFKISAPLHANIRRACGVDKILKETNVAVLLPTEDQPPDSVAFVGNSKDIPSAFHLSLARARVYVYCEVPCKPWMLKIMKQKPHLSFNDLKLNFEHTWISYLSSKECIALDGPAEDVETIKVMYTSEIDNMTKNMKFKSVHVPTSFMIHIEGVGARITKKICDATDTKIDFSENNTTSQSTPIDNQITTITIFGKQDDIEEAGELFDEYIGQLNEVSSSEVNIDSLLLPYVTNACFSNSIHEDIKRNFGPSLRVNVKNMRNKRVSCVSLHGKKGAVLGAQSYLDELVKRTTSEVAIYDVTIPTAYHHLLVGKKGVIRDEIMECSGVDRIIFPNPSVSNVSGVDDNYQSPPDVITLVGLLKACKLAEVHMVEKCNLDVELDQFDIQLPKSLVEKLRLGEGIILRRVIGNCVNNTVIVDDGAKSNAVNVHLPTGDLQPINHVRIHGYKTFTKAVSEKLLNYARTDSLLVESFGVDDQLLKSVIGKGGSQLKKFSEASSVDIIIASDKPRKGKSPKPATKNSTPTDNVYLMGTNQTEITKIKNQIIKFVKELKDTVELTVNVRRNYIKKFFSKKGDLEPLITQLCTKYPSVKIIMPREEDNNNNESEDISKQIRLKGPSKMTNSVYEEIVDLVKKWDSTIRIEFTLPYDHANLLRNIEKPNFASIGKEFNVTIRSFRDGDKATKPTSETTISVVVEGVDKQVNAAKQKIMACGPITSRFSAPPQYHRALIGPKGAELKKIVDGLNVSITFPDADRASDDVLVRGPREQIPTVIERLKSALDAAKKRQIEWEKNNHIVEMCIDSKWFSKLIGRGGKQIKALKTKLNVAISIPKNDSSSKSDESGEVLMLAEPQNEDETVSTAAPDSPSNNSQSRIIIRGEKKLCEEAKKTIEAMVTEWENTVSSEFDLPKSIHGKIRGARSATINRIQKKFKVEVRFAPIEEEHNNTIKVTGLMPNVENAIKHIKEIASQFLIDNQDDDNDTENYQIPDNMVDPWSNFKFTAVQSKSRSDSKVISPSTATTPHRASERPSISSEVPPPVVESHNNPAKLSSGDQHHIHEDMTATDNEVNLFPSDQGLQQQIILDPSQLDDNPLILEDAPDTDPVVVEDDPDVESLLMDGHMDE